MHVGLIAVFLILAVILIVGDLYLFVSGLTTRADMCQPSLGLRLQGIEPGSQAWEHAHRTAWPILFGSGALGTAHGTALAATTLMDTRISVLIVFTVSGFIVKIGLWLIAKSVGRTPLT